MVSAASAAVRIISTARAWSLFLNDFNTYLSRNPQNKENLYEVYVNRSIIFYTFGYYDDALQDINQSLEINKNDGEAYVEFYRQNKINFNKKVAFLFGSEASGLSNKEVSYANYTLQIPTNPDFKSLNLSHSVIIIAQVFASLIKLNVSKFSKSKKVLSASKKDIQAVANLCIKKLDEKNFFKPLEKKPIMLENLRSIFYRMELSEKETRILSSVFASLAKKGWLTKLWVSL